MGLGVGGNHGNRRQGIVVLKGRAERNMALNDSSRGGTALAAPSFVARAGGREGRSLARSKTDNSRKRKMTKR